MELVLTLRHSLRLLQAVKPEHDAPCGLSAKPEAAQTFSLQKRQELERACSARQRAEPRRTEQAPPAAGTASPLPTTRSERGQGEGQMVPGCAGGRT